MHGALILQMARLDREATWRLMKLEDKKVVRIFREQTCPVSSQLLRGALP